MKKVFLIKTLFTSKYYINLKCLILGAIQTLAFAPFEFLPAVAISFMGLLYIIQNLTDNKMQSFKFGWWFGLGHFTTSLYWFANPLMLYPDKFGWMVPFAVLLIPSILGLYTAIVTLIIFYFRHHNIVYVFAFINAWVLAEIMRTYFIIPFPWNLIGFSLTSSLELLQIAPYVGIFGSSLFVCFLGSFLYTRNKKIILASIMGICLVWIQGHLFIKNYNVEYYEDLKIRIVQPNILDHPMGDPKKQDEALKNLSELTTKNRKPDIKIIIWPEASFPYGYVEGYTDLSLLTNIIPNDGTLIFGTDRIVPTNFQYLKFHNSVMAISKNNEIIGKYDKEILVPFGEYIPFKKFLPFIDKITYGAQDFSIGQNIKRTITFNCFPELQPLICYEIIFPQIQISKDAKWLVNLTNDAWFGNTSGPYQLLSMAKFKAAEFRLPLIRVANNGVSAIITPVGTTLESLGLNSREWFDVRLIKNINFFGYVSKNFFIILPFLGLFMSGVYIRKFV